MTSKSPVVHSKSRMKRIASLKGDPVSASTDAQLNDTQHEEHVLERVEKTENGYSLSFDKCMGFFIPDVGIEPKAGEVARFYGKGLGFRIRGVTINGRVIYYRTPEQDDEYNEIEMYGVDAADWLKRWDEGRGVWSIEMGGLGPGYEQCIHITCAEILRHMLAKQYDSSTWSDTEKWKPQRDEIETMCFANERIKALGLSGAQWGAALNLAATFYRQGPRAVMKDERVKDRRIQVQRNFPVSA